MKIIYLISNIRKCGPVNVMNQIIEYLKDNEIFVISIFGNRDDEALISNYTSLGVKVYSLNLSKFDYILSGRKKLSRLIEKLNPDVINSHGIIPDLLVCNVKKYYKVSTVHSNIYEDYINRFGKIKGKLFIKLHEKSLKKMDKVVAVSKFISDNLNEKKIKSIYIRNGVKLIDKIDKKKYKEIVCTELNIPIDSIIFTFCGTLNRAKRVSDLVRLFVKNHCQNEYLIIMGDGPEKNIINEIIDKNVIMLGYVNDVKKYFCSSDIYISNSSTEGFSISILEALSAKNLLLLSNIPSHCECVSMCKNIYLGEVFNNNNFFEKKEILINHLNSFNNDILYIISSEYMAKKYKDIYNRID